MFVYKYTSIKSEVKSTILSRRGLTRQGLDEFYTHIFSETFKSFRNN